MQHCEISWVPYLLPALSCQKFLDTRLVQNNFTWGNDIGRISIRCFIFHNWTFVDGVFLNTWISPKLLKLVWSENISLSSNSIESVRGTRYIFISLVYTIGYRMDWKAKLPWNWKCIKIVEISKSFACGIDWCRNQSSPIKRKLPKI